MNQAKRRMEVRHKQLQVLVHEGLVSAAESTNLTPEDVAKIFAERESLKEKHTTQAAVNKALSTSALPKLGPISNNPHPPPTKHLPAKPQLTKTPASAAEVIPSCFMCLLIKLISLYMMFI